MLDVVDHLGRVAKDQLFFVRGERVVAASERPDPVPPDGIVVRDAGVVPGKLGKENN